MTLWAQNTFRDTGQYTVHCDHGITRSVTGTPSAAAADINWIKVAQVKPTPGAANEGLPTRCSMSVASPTGVGRSSEQACDRPIPVHAVQVPLRASCEQRRFDGKMRFSVSNPRRDVADYRVRCSPTGFAAERRGVAPGEDGQLLLQESGALKAKRAHSCTYSISGTDARSKRPLAGSTKVVCRAVTLGQHGLPAPTDLPQFSLSCARSGDTRRFDVVNPARERGLYLVECNNTFETTKYGKPDKNGLLTVYVTRGMGDLGLAAKRCRARLISVRPPAVLAGAPLVRCP